jgi:hypothetical protein
MEENLIARSFSFHLLSGFFFRPSMLLKQIIGALKTEYFRRSTIKVSLFYGPIIESCYIIKN